MRKYLPVAAVVLAAALAAACGADTAARQAQRLEKAAALEKSGRFSEAIIEYRNILKSNPNSGVAHLGVARAYEQVDDSVNAYKSYLRAADLLPGRADVQLAAAQFLLHSRQFADARARAARAVELEPGNAGGHMVLGSALAGMRDVDGAIDQVQEAIDLAPRNTAGYTGIATLLLTQGRTDEALAQFEKAVQVDPRSVEAHVALGAYRWSVGDTKDAETSLRRALAAGPDDPLANRAMALFCEASGRPADAEPYLKTVARAVGTPEAQLPLADLYVRTGRTNDARELLEKAAASGRSAVVIRLARLQYAQGQHREAYARIDALLARQPSNSDAMVTKGRWLLTDGDADAARAQAQAAIGMDPGSAAGHLLLGDAQVARSQLADAELAYNAVLRINPRIGAAQTALSQLNLRKGNPDAAVQFAREALLNEPVNDRARLLLVKGLLEQREFSRAAEEVKLLLARQPDDPNVRAVSGTLKVLRGDRAGARREFDAALSKDPGQLDALAGLTSLDVRDGQLERARARLQARLKDDGRNVQLLLLAARADFQAADYPAGEQRLREAIRRDPSNLQAYQLLGGAYVRQQKLDAAQAEFEAVVRKDPRAVGAYTILGMIHEVRHELNEAEKAYEKALQVDPRAAVAGNNLAYILADRGDNLEYALVLAQQASETVPDDPVVTDTLGWIYYKKNQPADAVAAFTKAARLAPAKAIYQFHLGLALAQSKETGKARAALEMALRLEPSFDGAAEARQALASLGGDREN